MNKLFLSLFLVLSLSLSSQNLVKDGDFEQTTDTITYVTGAWSGTKYYKLEDFLIHWYSLFGYPRYSNKKTFFYISSRPSFFPFKNNGYLSLQKSYNINKTTLKLIIYNTNDTGSSAASSKLKYPLMIDTTYILSYRFRNGNRDSRPIYTGELQNQQNLMGVLFSINTIPYSFYQTKGIPFDSTLQEYNIDSSYHWRLIKKEFKATDSFKYIHLGQFSWFKDLKYTIKHIGFSNGNTISFSLNIDDVRLLPKWQYLDVSPDTVLCARDTITLRVNSGAGTYMWSDVRFPNTILSTSSSLTIIATDSTKYQVMSPYDTALIQVDVIPVVDSLRPDTSMYSICKGDSLVFNIPNLYTWHDGMTNTKRAFNSTIQSHYITKPTTCKYIKNQFNIQVDSLNLYLPQDTILSKCQKDYLITPTLNGSLPYTYTWSNLNTTKTQTINQSGLYWLEAKNKGCLKRDSINIKFLYTPIPKDTIQIATCTAFKWNDSIYPKSGLYTQYFKSTNQCDSIVSIDIKIGINNKINLQNGINYTAIQDSVSYQWYRCHPWRKITNETKRTFTTSTKGSYAVVLESNKGCKDTSDCIALYSSGFATPIDAMTRIYPNPFNSQLTIDLDRFHKEINIKIYDLTGRLILNKDYQNLSTCDLKLETLTKGSYYIQIETENNTQFFNILKD